MNNFPITNEDFNSKFSYFSQKAMLPKFDWGKKLYIEYEGKLRAAIPYYSAAVSNKKKTGCPSQDGWKTVVCFNIAGIGKKLIKWEIYLDDHGRIKVSNWNLRIYKTTEDYERFISGEKNQQYVPDGVLVKDILRVHGYGNIKEHECWDYKVYGWCWNYEEPRECPLSFKDCWLNDEGGHITVIHEGWDDPKYPAYLTREECLAANRKGVVDFDENELEEEKPVKRLDHDSALICESIQEVTLVAWPMIYGKNNDNDLDSREVLDLFRTWGEEFESWWINHDEEWICSHDYIAEVEHFAEQKAAAYLESLK